MIGTGIDLGSRFIKLARYTENGFSCSKYDTVSFYKENIERKDGKVFIRLPEAAGHGEALATGYGRNLLSFDNVETISEIKAHFYGAKYQTGEDSFVLVDVGGQDCKVIEVKDGYINDFIMNDKCAASAGRFMEQAAGVLRMPLSELMRAKDNPAQLSDTCAVFCESEIIGLLARGVPDASLAAGVNLSVAKRLAPQIKRFAPKKIFASGGAVLSEGLLFFLSDMTGSPVEALKEPQFNGAIGCAVYLTDIKHG